MQIKIYREQWVARKGKTYAQKVSGYPNYQNFTPQARPLAQFCCQREILFVILELCTNYCIYDMCFKYSASKNQKCSKFTGSTFLEFKFICVGLDCTFCFLLYTLQY